jgi:hypothetical protein
MRNRNYSRGQIIKRILAFSGKHCQYYYIRTKRELRAMMERFTDSGYRYLHLSCHANASGMATTLNSINFIELADLMKPHLRDRRLFVSACSMTTDVLAQGLMSGSGCFSILGPSEDIQSADAVILWSSLYHVMFAADATAMKRTVLKAKAQEVANMYRVCLTYFGVAILMPMATRRII